MRQLHAANADIRRTAMEIIHANHPELARAHWAFLTIESDSTVPAIDVKVFGPNARASGSADVAVIIDHMTWKQATEGQRLAMLHRAIYSITLVVKAGTVKVDAAGRPRIRRRAGELLVGGYLEMIRRYGADSIEAAQASSVASMLRATMPKPSGIHPLAAEITERLDAMPKRGRGKRVAVPPITPSAV